MSGKDCLEAEYGDEDLPFRDNPNYPSLPNKTQVIVTSYRFRCCGKITAWLTYVRGTNIQNGVYDITFQVWRPSPTVQANGCYSLVGENIFTSISLHGGGIMAGNIKN